MMIAMDTNPLLDSRLTSHATVLLGLCVATGCTDEYVFPDDATMIAVGDSFLSWHKEDGLSIPEVAGRKRKGVMGNAAEPGAPVLGSDDWTIPHQYDSGPWDWVVVNGGGNDIMDRCDCRNCGRVMDRIISHDGQTGALRRLVDQAVEDGAMVAIVGYMNLLPAAQESPQCNDELVTLRERKQAMADSIIAAIYVDASEAMDGSNARLYDDDNLHPSVAGSRAVGRMLADAMATAEAVSANE